MCEMIEITVDGKNIRIAEMKKDCILNIVNAASKCDYIDKLVLFGSSITEHCTEHSDIDLAVFGNRTKAECFASAKYDRFTKQLYAFDDFSQDYDILYFSKGKRAGSRIDYEIENGEVIYERAI